MFSFALYAEYLLVLANMFIGKMQPNEQKSPQIQDKGLKLPLHK